MRAAAALLQLALGALFGVAVAQSGAADFDAMVRTFRFEEAHLFRVAIVTTLTGAFGLFVLFRSRLGEGVRVVLRSVHAGSVPGGVLFGVGWGTFGLVPRHRARADRARARHRAAHAERHRDRQLAVREVRVGAVRVDPRFV